MWKFSLSPVLLKYPQLHETNKASIFLQLKQLLECEEASRKRQWSDIVHATLGRECSQMRFSPACSWANQSCDYIYSCQTSIKCLYPALFFRRWSKTHCESEKWLRGEVSGGVQLCASYTAAEIHVFWDTWLCTLPYHQSDCASISSTWFHTM